MKFTYDQVHAALKAAVEEKGEDYVYTPHNGSNGAECKYVHNGQPDCGVGNALIRLGVPVELLDESLAEDEIGPIFTMYDYLMYEGFEFGPEARRLMGRFQVSQDRGLPWGDSLQDATEYARQSAAGYDQGWSI